MKKVLLSFIFLGSLAFAQEDEAQVETKDTAAPTAQQIQVCSQGSAKECRKIANALYKAKDYAEAKKYYKRACDLGDKKSCQKAQ
ncbi:hypothetical protein CQA57_01710 [Helicobacter anseris]|uniref:Beta-lactamase n=1 Tax=Helicobacter anseris TaxID=375926 RepID=A0A3D8JAX0_9HELI|nr:tetratricopeptide repeat protein [Helicobacter anseris]RDU74450.1 hypothetical protein CQA57_01710 [Helicobacter anseris]